MPEGAPEGGHGFYCEPESEEKHPLWAIRSLPGDDGSVRLGNVGSYAALVGESEEEQGEEVDEYEVLLDEGTWAPFFEHDLAEAGAFACGRLADGTPLFMSLGNTGDAIAEVPLEAQTRNDWRYGHPVLMAATGAETPPAAAEPAGSADATGYRWAPASGGEIPAGAPADGHGSGWYDTEDGEDARALWLIRAQLPDGSVQLGWAARGGPARVGTPSATTEVDEYEVLLDAGEWRHVDYTPTEDDSYLDYEAAGGIASGRLADGSPLYATLRDREDGTYQPGGRGARGPTDFAYQVLVAPAGAAADAPAPAATEPEAEAPAAAEPEPAGPTVIVRALDLKGEVVEIANTGDAPIDIGGWKLHDEGSSKGFVFPAGTVLEAGASVRVRSGPGAAKAGPGELKWKTSSVWNDKGDTAFLKDPSGELVDSMKA